MLGLGAREDAPGHQDSPGSRTYARSTTNFQVQRLPAPVPAAAKGPPTCVRPQTRHQASNGQRVAKGISYLVGGPRGMWTEVDQDAPAGGILVPRLRALRGATDG